MDNGCVPQRHRVSAACPKISPVFPISFYKRLEQVMSHHDHSHHATEPQDVVESIVPLMPVVLPVAGGVLMFLLAFIAVFMA